MIKACSHVVIASDNVPHITRFFSSLFEISPSFENPAFAEFILPSEFRIAFFQPVGAASKFFDSKASRSSAALGITVNDVDNVFRRATSLSDEWKLRLSGPPKDHPWGERSFLLIDPDHNRWEITQAPSESGMLVRISDESEKS